MPGTFDKVRFGFMNTETDAIYEHAKQYKWAYIVSQNERAILKNAIKHLMNNENERANLGQVAFNYAKNNYDSILIRSKFASMFR